MDPFEYVVVITSLISGLGIAQILTGTADIISGLKNIKLSGSLSLMVFTTFLNLIQEWYYNYQYATHVASWTLLVVLGLLIYPILLFVLARMLFPTGLKSGVTDLRAYFQEQWKWLYGISISIIVVSAFHDVFYSGFTLLDQTPKFIIISSYLFFIVLDVKSQKAHFIFQLFQTAGVVGFIVFTDSPLIDYNLINE
ncbi:MAG: hypothetical protein AAGA66_09955 [Bacteroidota bacterium]